jgi:integrase
MVTRAQGGIETRTARSKLAAGTRHHVKVGPGVHLFYRRGVDGAGTWQARRRAGVGYRYAAIGHADDLRPADGVEVLDYYEARERARTWAAQPAPVEDAAPALVRTVGDVLDHYVKDFVAQRKRGVGTVRSIVARAIRPELGDILVAKLTAGDIRRWMQLMAGRGRARRARKGKPMGWLPAPTDPDAIRARRATVNRHFTVLRAALNLAFEQGLVGSDDAWRRVRPFGKVDEPRIRFLTARESSALVEACAPDLRALVRAALLSGARFGELAAATVADFQASTRQFYVARSKSGRPRYVPLNDEGVALFGDLAGKRPSTEPLFRRASGTSWNAGDYRRGLELACQAAAIAPPIAFHELRHTYASLLAQAGCDLLTISKLLGHADTRITARHYAHLCDRTLRNAVTRLPTFEPPGLPPPTSPRALKVSLVTSFPSGSAARLQRVTWASGDASRQ